ncbi:MAG: DUF4136 domain-containing protein, partial [Calditrichia bacterium]|nr:DUF4136 domain-containing protein [Calditrichia bacterium]
IVGTFYDENVNFSAFKSYAMPDTIVHVDNSGVTTRTGDFDALILDQVAANMGAIGYTRVKNPDNADMLLTLAISKEGYDLGSTYNYDDYYGDRYDYGSGGYYNTGSEYQLETGTLLMNLANHKAEGGSAKPMWLGIINGVTEQSFTNTSRRLIELINQAYVQSPYLGTTPE